MARHLTDPGAISPDLNALRIAQLQTEVAQARADLASANGKIDTLRMEFVSATERTAQLKESRDKLGARLGYVEGEISDLRGWKKLLVVIGGIGFTGIGALVKVLIDAAVKGN